MHLEVPTSFSHAYDGLGLGRNIALSIFPWLKAEQTIESTEHEHSIAIAFVERSRSPSPFARRIACRLRVVCADLSAVECISRANQRLARNRIVRKLHC